MDKLIKPVSFRIFTILIFLSSLPAMIFGILAGISGPPPDKISDIIIIRSFAIFFPGFYFVCGIGLVKLKKWARWLAMLFSPFIAYVTVGVIAIFIPEISTNEMIAGMVIVAASIILYLNRPAIKDLFIKN